MAQIEINNVRGFRKGEKIFCWECVNPTDFTLDEFLIDDEMKPNIFYFCDKCETLLIGSN